MMKNEGWWTMDKRRWTNDRSRLRRAKTPFVLLILLFLAILLVTSGVASAATGGGAVTAPLPYDLSWWTVDGGGVGGLGAHPYTLDGTIGQPDAAGWAGDGYTLAGGFWGGEVEVAVGNELFLPLVMRNLS
jgi:hypothetical protein